MKNKLELLIFVFIGALLGGFLSTLLNNGFPSLNAATLNRGYTFTTNEQVTAAKLHSLVDSATISNIAASDFADGAITESKMAANSVSGIKIIDGTIQSADISNRTIIASNIASNSITEVELNTNLFFRAGFLSFSNATIAAESISNTAVQGVTTSSGSGDANKIVKLSSDGKLSTTLFNAPLTTNVFLTTEFQSTANVYSNLVQIVFGRTNGICNVFGIVHLKSKDSTISSEQGARLLSVVGSTTNTLADVSSHGPSEGGRGVPIFWSGTISATNTFILQGITDVSSAQLVWGGTSKDYYSGSDGAGTGGTNSTFLNIVNFPP